MLIGSRIKKIREFRKYTQKELGIKCGFPEDSADVRIRQYESNKKVPREETLRVLAKVLNVSYTALQTDAESPFDIIESLFWLEEKVGYVDLFSFNTVNDNQVNLDGEKWKYRAEYNKYDVERLISDVPIGIAINDYTLNQFLGVWLQKKNELNVGKITKEEYFEWKINWPESVDN